MENNKLYCSHCGALIEDDDYEEVNGEIVAQTVLNITRPPVTDVVKLSGQVIAMAMSIPLYAVTVMRITILAVPAATHCSMKMMHITLMVTTIAANAIMTRLIVTEASTITDTSLNRYSTVTENDISA